ncbi:Putative CCA tRNA nucleotidyltransferase 2 [Seminavis robusta]|uniref:CCA tRNA nucleotidyltransferase 2 n=1 Tax=Seminavis robusta TaxID=568900 RepID=A0A9N8HJL3_9STRA|nr:Putative CCA tRNA nucleotidyltransferase 2 [Seminavis robusta]|eukprot:Sro559_g166370.1 Putative CCA tRNA nucleotidyltransferase 2 (909) ;mRNA; r:3626-6454
MLVVWRVPAFSLPRNTARTSSSLAAINSRELRFHSGGTRNGSTPAGDGAHHQQSPYFTASMPEVLAASMSNYFFSKAVGTTSQLLAVAAVDEEQRLSTTTRRSKVSSTGAAAVAEVAPVVAQRQVLVTHHQTTTVRARSTKSSGGSTGGGDDDDDDDDNGQQQQQQWNTFLNRLNQHMSDGAVAQDDNTSLLHENIYRQPAGAFSNGNNGREHPPPRQGYGYSIQLTEDEKALFQLLRKVHAETGLTTTLRVAGGWVRDKLLATPEFQIFHRFHTHNNCQNDDNNPYNRLTSKFKQHSTGYRTPLGQASMGRQGTKVVASTSSSINTLGLVSDAQNGPVDIDIALDTMLGREFADHLNEYLQDQGEETIGVGVVLKNPEKSKHLETATMKVGTFWIDFVNLRAEEYAEDSRIPDLMRIGTAKEDAFRRDLTINSLFFNINTGEVEDWTGRGFADLRKGIVATPLAPLTTLLDDPLRVLRSVRFAARLRFSMGEELVAAAKDDRVRMALAQKVSRERVGGELDLMLRSPDPVGAMRLLRNLNLIDTVFPAASCWPGQVTRETLIPLFDQCLNLLSTTHDHLYDCKVTPPIWCQSKKLLTTNNVAEMTLTTDEEARRLLWYASFLKPIHDRAEALKQLQMQALQAKSPGKRAGKKANRSIMSKLLVDELKRPGRDADSVEKIMSAANDITKLIQSGSDVSATLILLSDVRVRENSSTGSLMSSMRGHRIDSVLEDDPVWSHAMEFRLMCSRVLQRVGPLWRAALFLSLSEQLASLNDGDHDYVIEGDVLDESKEERRQGIIEQYDVFAAALQQIGLIGIWGAKPLIDGQEMKDVLPYIPRGPAFRDVMDEQERWIVTHPGASKEPLAQHLAAAFPEFTIPPKDGSSSKKQKKKKPKKEVEAKPETGNEKA